jgi:16S rRNA (cytosine1402-N4)-methyltransferase
MEGVQDGDRRRSSRFGREAWRREMIESSVHKSVLLKETVDGLNLNNNSVVLDATLGGGGHAMKILADYDKSKIIAIDQDTNAIERARKKFDGLEERIVFVEENFRNLDKVLQHLGVGQVDAVMFDFGFSSDQLEEDGRGFSFMKDEPLRMTMKVKVSEEDLTAHEVVNQWEEGNLADIIYGYGEERYARRIAKAIVSHREEEIKTTGQLAKIIEDAVPGRYKNGRIHPATKTFQAIRIVVNDEIGAIVEGLGKAWMATKNKGRIVAISFHSLEDRVVKNFYKDKKHKKEGVLINKKPITASEEEIKNNPRARSAKLRIIEKI